MYKSCNLSSMVASRAAVGRGVEECADRLLGGLDACDATARTVGDARRRRGCPRGGYWGLWWCGRRCVAGGVCAAALVSYQLYAHYGWWFAYRLAAAPAPARRDRKSVV